MKKLASLLILLTISNYLFAQDTLYLKDGSEISGTVINIGDGKVYFENATTGKRKRHKKVARVIDDTDGVKVEYKKREVPGISKFLSGEITKGKASYYVIYKYIPGSGEDVLGFKNMGGYAPFFYIYKEGDKKAFKNLPNSLTTPFNKRLSKYFSDCSSLASKIKNKEFEFETTVEIVKFYNTNCN